MQSQGDRLGDPDYARAFLLVGHVQLITFLIDEIKIDQSFVQDIPNDPNDAAIVRAVIQIGRSLGMKTIAEGVEKVTQLIGEVSAASSEQAQGIDQQNKAVAEMDKLTQSNAANAEESASASEELSAQAKELTEMVALLVSVVGGGSRRTGV